MTERLFLDHPELQSATARVLSADAAAIVLDRTIFYARSGGQPARVRVAHSDGGVFTQEQLRHW